MKSSQYLHTRVLLNTELITTISYRNRFCQLKPEWAVAKRVDQLNTTFFLLKRTLYGDFNQAEFKVHYSLLLTSF